MSALTEADHEEITDTLLAARERIEHLTICGAALQAENDRLKAVSRNLFDALNTVVDRFGPSQSEYIFSKRIAIDKARAALAEAGELK